MRVALYCRVSTDEQKLHGLSIDAQKAALEEWAANHTIVDYYIDPGVSGRKPYTKRPEMMRLLHDVEQGRIDLIVFTKLDRWFRSVKEYYKVQDILDRNHVAWRAIQEDYETETSTGRFKVNVMLSVAQQEAERTADRVKAVFDEKKRRGEVLSGKTALGVAIVDKRLCPNDDAPKVKEIYNYYLSCRSIRKTAEQTEQLIGKKLTFVHVSGILANHVYKDLGIVTPEDWNAVQEIKKERGQRNASHGHVYLFSGLCRCSVCGRKMSAHQNGADGKYAYYYCRKQQLDGMCANKKSVSEKKIEKYLLLNIMREVERVNLRITAGQKKPEDINALRRRADKLTDLYMDDLISRDKYETDYKTIQDRIAKAQEIEKPIDAAAVLSASEAYLTLTPTGKKAFWSRLIKDITVTPEGDISFSIFITKSN